MAKGSIELVRQGNDYDPLPDEMVEDVNSRSRAGIRLFCFPYAGGSARIYRSWQEAMPPFVEVCPVEFPGRGMRIRDPLCTRLPVLLDDLLPFILRRQDRPFAFFGHSLGSLVAFELARWLKRNHGLEPVGIFASGFAAPHLPRRSLPIHALSDESFLKRLRQFNGTPEEILQNEGMMEVMMPILRADFAVAETYRHFPGQPLECPITAFGGLKDKDVNLSELDAWRKHTNRRFTACFFPGNHFFLHPQEKSILKQMSRHLREWVPADHG
ncbi:thioesterase II family protein [Kroppenstedtia pulmonis]|nr:thioesterase domain-containing protein [Kroppenstedtia pulmonis]